MTTRRPHNLDPSTVRRRRRGGRGGFTLLELVVAMAMVAILAVSLYASMRIAFKAKASAEAAIEPPRTAELAMEFLRDDIQNAIGPNGVLASTFEGADGRDDRSRDSDDLTFYTTADGPQHVDGNGDVKRVELAVEIPDGTNDHVLVRRVTGNLLSQVQQTPDEEVLCRGVGGFNLRYFNGSTWSDTWDSTQEDNTLPAAVEVTLQLDRPEGVNPNSADARSYRFVRVFPISNSTVAQDPNINSGDDLQ